MIAAAILIAAGVWAMLYRTNLGRNIRAAVADPDLLNATGVNVTRLYTTVFVIGAGLAGLGGAIVAPSQAIGSSIDTDVLVLAFAISVIGGLGSIGGSGVGAGGLGMGVSFWLVVPPPHPHSPPVLFFFMTPGPISPPPRPVCRPHSW